LHVTRLVVTRSGDAATTVRFQHPLIRAAIYDDIGPARRTALHHRAAAVLTGDQSLQHLVAAATQPDPEIVGLLRAAAKRHRAAGHWRSAARSLQDAARLSADAGSRDELKLAAADALLIAGDVAGASQLTSQLNLKSPTAHQLVVQARLVSLNGDHDAGKAFAEQAWDRAADLDPATRDSVAAMLTEHYLSMDKAADGLAWADQSLASRWLPRQQAPETVGARATALGMLGRIREGLASLDDMPADPFQLPYAQRDRARHRGTLRLWGDDVAGAITDLRAASGDPEFRPSRHAIISVAVLVDAYFRAGRWDDCTGLIDRATSLIEDTGQIWFASFIHTHAALVPGARGEWDAAERILYRATEAAGRIPTPAQSHFLAEAIGHVAACRGEWPAVITLAEVMRLGHGAATQPGIFTWPVRYAEALVCTGDHVAAEDWLSTLEQQARAQRHRSRLAGIARIRGQLAAARRDHQKARAAFKLAIQLSEGINALEHASALLGYGRYLRRRGERRGAAGQLRNARQCAQALHATPLLDACDAELKAGGMEIHTTLNEPLHTLTPQERVVTGLICAGKTNRQIATELVLSIKTIDYHINNVYHKLNVHSRSELIAKTVKDTAGL